jgi:anaerobic selenocysteine-containing dehydrogenase
MVSFQKAMWGDAATAENDWCLRLLPKLDVPSYDILRMFELMSQGKVNGYLCQGFNPLLAFPDRGKVHRGALEAEVPRHDGPARDGDGALLGESRRVQRREPGRASRPR